jgi:hypothetical protein
MERKRKKSLLLLSFLILALISVFILTVLNSPQNAPVTSGSPEEDPDVSPENVDKPQPTPSGPVFVIPENPLGTTGVLIASTLAILIFALKKKKY